MQWNKQLTETSPSLAAILPIWNLLLFVRVSVYQQRRNAERVDLNRFASFNAVYAMLTSNFLRPQSFLDFLALLSKNAVPFCKWMTFCSSAESGYI
jgi:hypothetical protein